jgi:hypothetical protein
MLPLSRMLTRSTSVGADADTCPTSKQVMINEADAEQHRSTVIQLISRRTAEPDGVADYALALARAWRNSKGANTVFLSATPLSEAIPLEDEWKTVCVPERKAQALSDTIEKLSADRRTQAVILHFSGYGYEKRGVPVWLAAGLRLWKRRASVPIITIFHELYATGRPWQRVFWISPFQKQIARQILHLSSAAITPTNFYKRRLSDWQPRSPREISVLPVFSNIGEPGCGTAPYARRPTAVVFGLAGVENYLYGLYRSQAERMISALGIKEIIDIGLRLSPVPRSLAGAPVVSTGVLPSNAISELLQGARFGLIAYPVDFIAKSGVFGAYAAHGVVPIVFSNEDGTHDGLQPEECFIDGLRLEADADAQDLNSIQRKLFTWYSCHSVQVQANAILNAIAEQRALLGRR